MGKHRLANISENHGQFGNMGKRICNWANTDWQTLLQITDDLRVWEDTYSIEKTQIGKHL